MPNLLGNNFIGNLIGRVLAGLIVSSVVFGVLQVQQETKRLEVRQAAFESIVTQENVGCTYFLYGNSATVAVCERLSE